MFRDCHSLYFASFFMIQMLDINLVLYKVAHIQSTSLIIKIYNKAKCQAKNY